MEPETTLELQAGMSYVRGLGDPQTRNCRRSMAIFHLGVANVLLALFALWREAQPEPTHVDDFLSLARVIGHDPNAIRIAEHDANLIVSVIAGCGL